MKLVYILIIGVIITAHISYAQTNDSTKVIKNIAQDSTLSKQKSIIRADSAKSKIFNIGNKSLLAKPTMPPLRISEKQKKMKFNMDFNSKNSWLANDKLNYDALNLPTKRVDYELPKDYTPSMVPMTPLEVPEKNVFKPLPFQEYSLPTREELDILEVLWARDEVMDTTIYSCLDSMAITFDDLRQLLSRMDRKGLVGRKIVSPRWEFNAFGVLIEMSPQNRRNRVYEYKSKVDEQLMKKFIDANAYLFQSEPSIVNVNRLHAARNDSTLLRDLNKKIKMPSDHTQK